jgi:hypothetical protein
LGDLMGLNSRGRVTAVAAAALAAVIACGGTYALAGQGSSTLSACVHRHGGALYEAKKCAMHDRKLTWAITGPEGPAGPTGATGAKGANGANGANGTNGANGINGIGATTSPVALTLADNEDLASLGSASSVYGACNQSGGSVLSVVSIVSTGSWQVSGSYTTYQLQANGTAIVQNGSATSALGTYAIAATGATGSGQRSVAYTLVPASSPGLVSGEMHVSITSGATTSDYEVTYNIETEPGASGAADLCTGEVTVVPTS